MACVNSEIDSIPTIVLDVFSLEKKTTLSFGNNIDVFDILKIANATVDEIAWGSCSDYKLPAISKNEIEGANTTDVAYNATATDANAIVDIITIEDFNITNIVITEENTTTS